MSNVMNCTTDMAHHTTLALSQHQPMEFLAEHLTVSMVRMTKKLVFSILGLTCRHFVQQQIPLFWAANDSTHGF